MLGHDQQPRVLGMYVWDIPIKEFLTRMAWVRSLLSEELDEVQPLVHSPELHSVRRKFHQHK